MSARSEKVTFRGAHGDRLAARLDRPRGRIVAQALFAHCFTCSKDIFAASRISSALNELGIAVLRFDFTGLGASEGEFSNTNFSSNVEDLLRAVEYLGEEQRPADLLIGHSLGGAAVLAAASDIASARAVVTIGAPADPEHVSRLFAPKKPEIEARGEAEVTLAGRTFRIKKQFLEDIAAHRLEEKLGSLKRALLVCHAPLDSIVGIDNASRIFAAARHPKSFLSLDDADHLLSRHDDSVYVARVIAAWASRFVESSQNEKDAGDEPSPEILVEETGEGKFTQRIVAGAHVVEADEPRAAGGLDRGMSPYDLLLAALGSCTSMTLRLYAAKKGLSLNRVRVRLSHRKIHARDCDECETREGKLDEIEREITLEGSLDEGQRTRLLEIADKCPVHRTLRSEVVVRTREA